MWGPAASRTSRRDSNHEDELSTASAGETPIIRTSSLQRPQRRLWPKLSLFVSERRHRHMACPLDQDALVCLWPWTLNIVCLAHLWISWGFILHSGVFESSQACPYSSVMGCRRFVQSGDSTEHDRHPHFPLLRRCILNGCRSRGQRHSSHLLCCESFSQVFNSEHCQVKCISIPDDKMCGFGNHHSLGLVKAESGIRTGPPAVYMPFASQKERMLRRNFGRERGELFVSPDPQRLWKCRVVT